MTAIRHIAVQIHKPATAHKLAEAHRPKLAVISGGKNKSVFTSQAATGARHVRFASEERGRRDANDGVALTRSVPVRGRRPRGFAHGDVTANDTRNATGAANSAAGRLIKDLSKEQAEQLTKSLGKLGGKFATKASPIATLALAAWSISDAWKKEGKLGPKTQAAIAGALGGAAGAAIGGALGGPIGAALGSLVGSYLGPKAYEFAKDLGKEYIKYGKAVAEAAGKAITLGIDAVTGIGKKIGEVVDDLGGFAEDIFHGVTGAISDAFDGAKNIGGDIVHGLGGLFG